MIHLFEALLLEAQYQLFKERARTLHHPSAGVARGQFLSMFTTMLDTALAQQGNGHVPEPPKIKIVYS